MRPLPPEPGGDEVHEPDPPLEPSARQRSRGLVVLSAIVAALLGIAGGWFARQAPVPPAPAPTPQVTITEVAPAPVEYAVTRIRGRSLVQVVTTEILAGCLPFNVGGGTYVDRAEAESAAHLTQEQYAAVEGNRVLFAGALRIPEGSPIYEVADADARYFAVVIMENCL